MSTGTDPDLSAFGFEEPAEEREILGTYQGCPVYEDNDPEYLESRAAPEPPHGLDPRVAPEVQALVQQEFQDQEKAEAARKRANSDPLQRMADPEKLVDFVNQHRRLGLEKIEANLVEETTPVVLWKLRQFALLGMYTQARACEIWLNWADKVRSRPSEEKRKPSAASAAFMPRGTTTEGEATPVDAKPRPHLGSAGKFIGKAKRLRAPKRQKAGTDASNSEDKPVHDNVG